MREEESSIMNWNVIKKTACSFVSCVVLLGAVALQAVDKDLIADGISVVVELDEVDVTRATPTITENNFVINADNYCRYAKGFTIACGVTVIWDFGGLDLVNGSGDPLSDFPIKGKIKFKDATSILKLCSDLYLTEDAQLFSAQGGVLKSSGGALNPASTATVILFQSTYGAPRIHQEISNQNGGIYAVSGFSVPDYTTYEWSATLTVQGIVDFVSADACLKLEGVDFYIGNEGALFDQAGLVSVDGSAAAPSVIDFNQRRLFQTITDDNASADDSSSSSSSSSVNTIFYTDGFIVPAHATYIWNLSVPASFVVDGTITFADVTGRLELRSDLYVNDNAVIAQEDYVQLIPRDEQIINAGNSDAILVQGIDDCNVNDYLAGYEFNGDTTFIWNVTDPESKKVTGNFTFSGLTDNLGLLLLSDLYIAASGKLFEVSGGIIVNSVSSVALVPVIIRTNGNTIFQDIDPSIRTASDYAHGFTIPSSATFILLAELTVDDPIIFTDATSCLDLRDNLYLVRTGILFDRTGLPNNGGKLINLDHKIITQDITNLFLGAYINFKDIGFVVPADTVYDWQSTTSVSGKIMFADESATLSLYADLALTDSGIIFDHEGDILPVLGNTDIPAGQLLMHSHRITQQLSDVFVGSFDDLSQDYITSPDGFIIPVNTTYIWSGTPTLFKPHGDVKMTDTTSLLVLLSDIEFYPATYATISMPDRYEIIAEGPYAVIDASGGILYQAITDENVSDYARGFSVGNPEAPAHYSPDSLYDLLTTSTINGKISFDTPGSVLKLDNSLYLGRLGWIVPEQLYQVFTNGYNIYDSAYNNCVVHITDENRSLYTAREGFHIGPRTIYDWNATAPADNYVWGDNYPSTDDPGRDSIVSGPITFENPTSVLQLRQNLFVGAPQVEYMPWGGFTRQVGSLYDASGKVDGVVVPHNSMVVQWVNMGNANKYGAGFVIPSQARIDWFTNLPVSGHVAFTDATSILNLLGGDSDANTCMGMLLGDQGDLFHPNGMILATDGSTFLDPSYVITVTSVGGWQNSFVDPTESFHPNYNYLNEYNGQTYVAQVINSNNQSAYERGFVVPANADYIWLPDSLAIPNDITFADPSSALNLIGDIHLLDTAAMFPVSGILPYGKYVSSSGRLVQDIAYSNADFYSNGFTVPAAVTYNWLFGAPRVNGEIDFIDDTSKLDLFINLDLSDTGSMFALDGTIPAGTDVLDVGEFIVTQAIDNNNFEPYQEGFFVPSNANYIWAGSQDRNITSTIHFTDESSFLVLERDLYLGLGGSIEQGKLDQVITGTNKIYLRLPGNPIPQSEVFVVSNPGSYSSSRPLIIPAGMICVWDSNATMNGNIRFEDETAVLLLNANLNLSSKASLYNAQGELLNPQGSVVDASIVANGNRIIHGIQGGQFRPGAHNFTIPAYTTYIWGGEAGHHCDDRGCHQQQAYCGTITFADSTSALKLAQDLVLAPDAAIIIDGDFAQIFGENKQLVLGGDLSLDKPLAIMSPLTIHGKHHTLTSSSVPAIDMDYQVNISLKDLTIVLNADAVASGITFSGFPYEENAFFVWGWESEVKLHEVTFTIPAQFDAFNSLGFPRALFRTCAVTVDCKATVLGNCRTQIWSEGCSLDITANSTFRLGSSASEWFADTGFYMYLALDDGSSASLPITMTPTSTLFFDGQAFADNDCNMNIYFGACGNQLKDGIIKFTGDRTYLKNVDYINNNPTNDLGRAVIFESSLRHVYAPDAAPKVPADDGGYVITMIDDSNFATMAQNGFTIPDGMIYQYNCSPCKKVNGPMVAGAGSSLLLASDLYLGCHGVNYIGQDNLFTYMGAPVYGDYAVKFVIDCENAKHFADGFNVADNTTYVWKACETIVDGPITFGSGELLLEADLHLGQDGIIKIGNTLLGLTTDMGVTATSVVAHGHTIYDATREAILVGINDDNYATYQNGFTIADGVTYEWDCAAGLPLLGTVTFGNMSSSLKLMSDLHLDIGAAFRVPGVAGESFTGRVYGHEHRIVLDAPFQLDIPLQIWSDVTLEGNGQEMVANCCPIFDIWGPTVHVENIILNVHGDTVSVGYRQGDLIDGYDAYGPYLFWGYDIAQQALIFDNVTIKPLSAFTQNALVAGYLNDTLQVTIQNDFVVDGIDVPVRIAADDSMVGIASSASLSVQPGSIIELGPEANLVFADYSSVLALNNCDLWTGTLGATLLGGSVLYEGGVRVHSGALNDDTSEAILMLGDGEDGTMNIIYLADAALRVDGNYIVNDNSGPI